MHSALGHLSNAQEVVHANAADQPGSPLKRKHRAPSPKAVPTAIPKDLSKSSTTFQLFAWPVPPTL